jgi:N-methylhydantoinase B/oxoprolinase/acetone carboxylase alpha subunit
MNLGDLQADVAGRLPEDRRKAVQALVEKYGAGENLRFILTLVAVGNKRDRRLVRLLLNELEDLDERRKSSEAKEGA